ncbi:MAG: DASS family sodium-coupled anion symporter [Methanobrevibacter sp.]|nr:DASS family sodium-coupled anion symporter [Methanobrevibacter sp.]
MKIKKNGLLWAIGLTILTVLLPLEGLSFEGHMAIGLLVFAVVMWGSEALPLPVTSLIILFLQPIMHIATFRNAVTEFANPIIFLMIGGFIIAEGIRKSGLVQRLTYFMLDRVGTSANMCLFVCVFATGLLSVWIENVVAFALVIPIIKEVIDLLGIRSPQEGKSNFAKAGILGACFASLSGGLATQISTAPNLIASAYVHIPFANWMLFGFPITIILLFTIWKYLGFIFPSEVKEIPGGHQTIKEKLTNVGKVKRDEKVALILLLFTISLWVTGEFTGLTSYAVALIGASLFFVFNILEWQDAQRNVDWGLVLFFGGALSMGATLVSTGAGNWLITHLLSLLGPNPEPLLIVLILMVVGVLLTQFMSNVVIAAILIPLIISLPQAQGELGMFAVPIALACSLPSVLPMSDPTVAITYGLGYINATEVIKAGVPIIIVGIFATILMVFTIGRPLIGG